VGRPRRLAVGETRLAPRLSVGIGLGRRGYPARRTRRFILAADDTDAGPVEHSAMRRSLVAIVVMAVLTVGAVAVAATVTHDDDSPSPEHTVRDFLLAAVSRHDGLRACRYLGEQAVIDVDRGEPRGMSCEAAVSDYAQLTLGGSRFTTEAAVKGLTYRAETARDGTVTVTVSSGGAARSFALRRATRRELVEYLQPPTPWRIEAGVAPLLKPLR
jgi:hypothetical protein